MPCVGARATNAAVYSHKLCQAILSGARRQLEIDGTCVDGSVWITTTAEQFGDDLTKHVLDPTLVKAARRTDIASFKGNDVREMAAAGEAIRVSSKAPISVRLGERT